MKHPIEPVYITQKFGERPEYYKQYGLKGHNGQDYRTKFFDSPLGRRDVYSPENGKVIFSGLDGGYGICVKVKSDKYIHVLAHLKKFNVINGQQVNEGQVVGISDNTGNSSGPHHHWGVRPINYDSKNGYAGYIDPASIFTTNNKIMFGRLYSSRGSGESPFELNGRRPCLEFDGKRHGFVSEAMFNKLYGPEFELPDAPSDAGDKEWGERVDLK